MRAPSYRPDSFSALEEPSKLPIGGEDLRVIEILQILDFFRTRGRAAVDHFVQQVGDVLRSRAEAGQEVRRRLVGPVRVEEMKEQEAAAAIVERHFTNRGIDERSRGDVDERVIAIEAFVETEGRREKEARDDPDRLVAVLREHFREVGDGGNSFWSCLRPCSVGRTPVSIDMCVGRVQLETLTASSKTTPSLASASRTGVVSRP